MNWHGGYRMETCRIGLTRSSRSCASRSFVASAAVLLLVLAAYATTEAQMDPRSRRDRGRPASQPRFATTGAGRFPLNYAMGQRAALDPATAREALEAYRRMGADLEQRGRFAQAAIAYTNAATSARSLGRIQDSLGTSQKAVEMAERAGDQKHLAPALARLGQSQMDLNAPQRAIPFFERAAQYAREASNLNAEAGAYVWLSKAYRRLGKPELALESTERAVAILQSAILRMQGHTGRLGPKKERVLWNLERNHANALMDLGMTHQTLHQWEPARSALQKALDAAKRTSASHLMAQARLGLGRMAVDRGDPGAAVPHLQEALRLSQQPQLVDSVERLLGRCYRETGNLPEAEKALRKAVAGIEDMRSQLQSEEHRESFVEDKMGAYAMLIQVLFDQGKRAEAFNLSERARARAFLDLLGNRVSLSRGRTAALIAEEKALQERIAHLKARASFGEEAQDEAEEEEEEEDQKGAQPSSPPSLQGELDLAREAYNAFLARVRAQSREQASLMTVEPLTLPDVQALLEPDMVLLEYFVGGGRTLLWVVGRNALRAVRLPIGEEELTSQVSKFRELIASRGRTDDVSRTAHDLFQSLLGPAFRSRLPRKIIVVPHRALHYLPFHALMPAPGQYLIQDTQVSYLSSASLLQFTREKQAANTPATLAVGNPDLEDPSLNLRYAEREVREVERLLPPATVLVGKEATKTQTRRHLEARSLVHLAMHADLDEEDPLGSVLRLAPSQSDDGRLEVQEIFGWELDASLVVLSACETGLGKLTRGDELTGLTRAFIYAGTPSIVTTLWKVSDRASYELMRDFYRQLKAGKEKADALRQAQVTTLQAYPHPYYWAAYQLTGEPR